MTEPSQERGSPIARAALRTGVPFLLCFWPALLGIAQRSLEFNGYYDHLLLALLGGAYLLREQSQTCVNTCHPSRFGWPPLLAGLWLNLVGRAEGVLFLQVLGLWLVLAGTTVTLLGFRGFWRCKLPFAFLLLCIPIPRQLVDGLTSEARLWVTQAAVQLLSLAGVPSVAVGSKILLSSANLSVDPSCSGLQGVLAFVALGMFAAHSATGVWRKSVLIGMAIPIAFLGNLLRVLALVALSLDYPGAVLHGASHDAVGLAVYAFAMLLLVAVGHMIRVPLVQPEGKRPVLDQGHIQTLPFTVPTALGIAGIVCMLLPTLPGSALPVVLPPRNGGEWRGHAMPIELEGAAYVRYEAVGSPSFVDALVIRRNVAASRLHPPRGCFPTEGFVRLSAEYSTGNGLPPEATLEVYARGEQRFLVASWSYTSTGASRRFPTQAEQRLRGVMRWLVPIGLTAAATDVRLVTPHDRAAFARIKSVHDHVIAVMSMS